MTLQSIVDFLHTLSPTTVFILTAYMIFVNVFAFFLCLADKVKAFKGAWRIPEKTLLGISIIGGSVGMLLGMLLFRHKTKHASFMIGVPFIIAVQVAIVLLLLSENNVISF